jgi:adenylate cyclase
MPELHAKGAGQTRRWELTNQPVTLGRTGESLWQVPWDKMVSAIHVTLTWKGESLFVQRRLVPRKTTNPVFFNGSANDEFSITAGEEFVIGETTFRLVESSSAPSDVRAPVVELACGKEELRRHRYVDAAERIEVLAALPGVIRTSPGEAELEARVVDVLMRGIPRAEAAIVIQLQGDDGSVKMCTSACHGKDISEIRPSRRLVREALLERKQSVMHVWQSMGHGGTAYTMMGGYDWALCTPLPDDPAPGWGLYLAGFMPEVRLGGPSRDDILKGDLKFAELVADVFGSLRQVSTLQRREGQLSRFLSRPVVAALAGRDIDATLAPRQAMVTVLFCDLRGSCAIAEDGQGDLMALWAQINAALTIMSSSILEQDGVIGDFQGDAAMGFWGWPLERDDQMERAAKAALSIRRQFAAHTRESGHPLARFACGIGIAHGPGIAGRLGTADQFKVDVFGPIVNLAARLESMTKRFGVAILVDESCAKQLELTCNGEGPRCRRLARVRPYGFKRELMVSELLPPASEPGAMPEVDRLRYEKALDTFMAGQWAEVNSHLASVPRDGAVIVLTDYIKANPHGPPADWGGVIVMDGK